MFRWIPYAFVRITLFFCAGITTALYLPGLADIRTGLVLLLSFIILYGFVAYKPGAIKPLPGLIAMIILFIAGYSSVCIRDESSRPDHIVNSRDTILYYQARVSQPSVEKEHTSKVTVRVDVVKTRDGWHKASGNILLYLARKAYPSPVSYGDVLLIKGNPQRVSSPPNPAEFDYRRFLALRQIYHQHFVGKDAMTTLARSPSSRFLEYAFRTRHWADRTLKRFIDGPREQALATALVLGVTDGLDDELMSAYSATGAMHVLSVSGLHVGIVYWLILVLFKPFQRYKQSKWILAAVSLSVLWSYAFVTGISPSVMRAVTMFSFAAIARAWNFPINIYNILAASAFFLLLFDPFMIASVGFQLSYLAVLGIVSIQPALYRLWEPSSRILDEIWKVAAVSIAAQLATLFLGLYYFHQFPNYFLLTNLVVIPGSFMVLMGGIVILSVSFFDFFAGAIGFCVHWIIKIVNTVVFGIEQIPFSVMGDIQITTIQCLTGLLMIATIIYWSGTRRYHSIHILLLLCVVYSLAGWLSYHTTKDTQLTIYAVRGVSAIDLLENGRTFMIGDTSLDAGKINFHIQPNRLLHHATVRLVDDQRKRDLRGASLTVWHGKSILRVFDKAFRIPSCINLDFIILGRNSIRSLEELPDGMDSAQIILDSSFTFADASRMLKQAQDLGLRVYSVLHNGAFNFNFDDHEKYPVSH